MRVMVLIKADERAEAGELPDQKYLEAMLNYNEELVKAGVLLAGEGLAPTSRGKRVRFKDGRTTVIDGPFTETKELLAGYWLWQVRSMEEAVEWVKRIPVPEGYEQEEGVVEIREVFEPEEFGDTMTPEMQEKDRQWRSAGNQ
ncbi:YciI family protein [Allorhizocola rhizosphaerae]|uniref:YciI family protein n=1 Tax=Allorhizocola rhizosphaerae TaxID=1872709 RepID=UPI000E3CB6EE|nr:YciI family protein [Allorhizocola rhizosphaerae]